MTRAAVDIDRAPPTLGDRPRAAVLSSARAACALLVGIALVACASAPPERFYRLPEAQPAAAVPVAGGMVIAIGPVALPELVDRPQIVTGSAAVAAGSGTRVQLWESQRWAEPLRVAIGRVVAAQLSAALAAPQVLAYPQVPAAEPAYRVTLNVQRFDAELGVGVNDDVLWTVRRGSEGPLRSGRSVVSKPALAGGHEAIVSAHAAALEVVAKDVAGAVAELARH